MKAKVRSKNGERKQIVQRFRKWGTGGDSHNHFVKVSKTHLTHINTNFLKGIYDWNNKTWIFVDKFIL